MGSQLTINRLQWLGLVLALGVLSACGSGDPVARSPVPAGETAEAEAEREGPATATEAMTAGPAGTTEGATMRLTLTSSGFENEASIPERYTCDGDDVSPDLSWDGVPDGAVELALIMDDPDAPAGTWVHWVLYRLPGSVAKLEEDVPDVERLPSGALHGENSWGELGYGGPCPPSGTHRYFFRLYAIDTRLDLGPGASKQVVLTALEGHILDQAELMGRYSR